MVLRDFVDLSIQTKVFWGELGRNLPLRGTGALTVVIGGYVRFCWPRGISSRFLGWAWS